MKKNSYLQKQEQKLLQADPRAAVVLQRAKAYRVDTLSNIYLLEELFNIDESEDICQDKLEILKKSLEACSKAIEQAQMSKN